MAELHGSSSYYVGPYGCSSTRIVTKSSPKPIPGATDGFRKRWNLGKFSGDTKQPKHQQFWGFWEAHGAGYMGLVATSWVPMGAQVPLLSPSCRPETPFENRFKTNQPRPPSSTWPVSQ